MKFQRLEKRIPLSIPTMHGDERKFVEEAFDTNWIAPVGPNVDAFEKEMAEYLGIEGTSAVSSGTAALHLAYKLADIGKDDIVLVQDLTFAATVNPIIYQNAIPVFIDSDRETWNMDPEALRIALDKYKDRVKAVVVVHLYGIPSKLDEILELCEEYNVQLIEDAAESLSATYKGKQTGTFGKYAGISFNGNKLITTSSGGMVLSSDKKATDKAKFWATQAKDPAPWYQHTEIGYNYRLSNVLAGIGRGQLLHLEEHKDLKTKIYKTYEKDFDGLPISMNPYLEDSVPSFWLSAMIINEEAYKNGLNPEELKQFLDACNIEARRIWKPMHLQPVFQEYDYVIAEESSVTEDIFARGLCLPSDIKMTEDEQKLVIKAIKEFVG
ncbi:aminotransferase class I/II-fold pyridoxal phosphate-dependent enzyme [uncultured Helcococcus sp.]|uniref:DegT/DnrJ/EryC1/StrS family aminotransferase n=1 Tax=uncultured Helcococcus sp. TaxID=1072508 RepID=UPI0026235067|nr:aminotransferase class I/II-fold pyridoxal phosphate-dependent enzyme [uncultured Helcococcus sp.]